MGKSTCLNVLTGLLDLVLERYFDDKLVSLYENDLWQSHIGYVSQSNYLFNTSIMENITFQNNSDQLDYKNIFFLKIIKFN